MAKAASNRNASAEPTSWDSVFDAHPEAAQIWVVDSMPFLDHEQALNYARTVGGDALEVKRGSKRAGEQVSE